MVAILGLVITLPVYADEEGLGCNAKQSDFAKWCFSSDALPSQYMNVGDDGCVEQCNLTRDLGYSFEQESKKCASLGGHGQKGGDDPVDPYSPSNPRFSHFTCEYGGNNAKQPPKADFSVSPSSGKAPLTVSADGNSSTDSDGSVTSYQWSTSDGKTATGSTASFVFDKAGTYTITLIVNDNDGLTGSTQHSVTVTDSEINVTSVKSKYPEKTHFLDGVDHDVTYKAEIDWGKQEPGTVSFITPTGTKDVIATGNTAEQSFNMGKDFGVCGKLKVVATSKDGKKKSSEKEADFVVMSSPLGVNFIRVGGVDIVKGNSFSYAIDIGGINFEFIDYVSKKANGNFPIFGKNALGLRFIPKVSVEITSEGKTKVSMNWEGANKSLLEIGDPFEVVKRKVELQPTVNIEGEFKDCQWFWGGM